MKIAISAESTLDFQKELIESKGLEVLPFQITLGDKTFSDGEITPDDIFGYVEKTGVLPKTNAINAFTYGEFFEGLLKKYDAVIHISMSSGISSTYNNAVLAANELKNVYVVDSLSLTTGIGFIASEAKMLADNGKTVEEILAAIEELKKKLVVTFIIERLDYLYKGGRCSGVALLGANILKIRPRIILKDGKMSPDKKYRGAMEIVIKKYAEDLLAEHPDVDKNEVFLTYTTVEQEMLNAARAVLKAAAFENIYETHCNSTVSSHCGANTLGIIFKTK